MRFVDLPYDRSHHRRRLGLGGNAWKLLRWLVRGNMVPTGDHFDATHFSS